MWGIGVPLLLTSGIDGFVFVPVIVSAGVVGLAIIVRAELQCSFSAEFALPWAAALLSGSAVYLIGQSFAVENLTRLAISGIGGTALYLVFLIIFVKTIYGSSRLRTKIKGGKRQNTIFGFFFNT